MLGYRSMSFVPAAVLAKENWQNFQDMLKRNNSTYE
jgi:hypothetical protein